MCEMCGKMCCLSLLLLLSLNLPTRCELAKLRSGSGEYLAKHMRHYTAMCPHTTFY